MRGIPSPFWAKSRAGRLELESVGYGAPPAGERPSRELRGVRDPKRLPKIAFARFGSLCSKRVVYELNGAFNYLHCGWWLSSQGFVPEVEADARGELFELAARGISDRSVLYLEFGVHKGDSMRLWSRLLHSPDSHLHGFDSFMGLPHDWTLEGHKRGHFSTGGAIPEIDDPRVRFFRGWFEDTLPGYEWPDCEVLVVMLDADLYSSTATALDFVAERLIPGSYLYFDQFHHRADELRAFAEFYDEHEMQFRLVGVTRDRSRVLFQRTA
jgi:Macrocin-O-methyltransferase (TylF)